MSGFTGKGTAYHFLKPEFIKHPGSGCYAAAKGIDFIFISKDNNNGKRTNGSVPVYYLIHKKSCTVLNKTVQLNYKHSF